MQQEPRKEILICIRDNRPKRPKYRIPTEMENLSALNNLGHEEVHDSFSGMSPDEEMDPFI